MKDIFVKPDITIRQAMKLLSQSGKKCLVITDEKNILLGTLSDGDVRNTILKGSNFGDSIKNIYQRKPTVLLKGRYTLKEAKKLFVENKFDLVPVVNEKGVIVDILFLESVLINGDSRQIEKLNVPVVIMAGGRGTRLDPFTKILPKPLVPINEKPIIEYIIKRFTDVGCHEFHLTVNYKGQILKAYFEDMETDYRILFVQEEKPLGTAGSLRFLEGKFKLPFFVTNCDIIIKADYSSLYEFHLKGGYDVSLVASTKEYILPYGTCELNGEGYLSRINEKPSYNFLINTGFYVLNPEVLKLIPKDRFYHITHLIEEVKKLGKKVGVFPIDDDDWIDVGEWTEYQKAVERFKFF